MREELANREAARPYATDSVDDLAGVVATAPLEEATVAVEELTLLDRCAADRAAAPHRRRDREGVGPVLVCDRRLGIRVTGFDRLRQAGERVELGAHDTAPDGPVRRTG